MRKRENGSCEKKKNIKQKQGKKKFRTKKEKKLHTYALRIMNLTLKQHNIKHMHIDGICIYLATYVYI